MAVNKPMKEGREKYWNELDAEAKIERLRQVIKEQERTIGKMAGYLDRLINHEHLNGRLVQTMSHPNAENHGSIHYHRKRNDEWI